MARQIAPLANFARWQPALQCAAVPGLLRLAQPLPLRVPKRKERYRGGGVV